ncbi:MAG: GspH/FimT family pseudopilin [Gammaproteobacteria bacterium]|nr:GspH/FimT family pseudopilin [Gammaproteobacteria bacterium]
MRTTDVTQDLKPGPLKRTVRGFTLIELMITIAVVGVLLGVALPSFQETMKSQRAKSVASDLHLSYLLARSEALKRSASIDMRATGGNWTQGWTVEIQSSGTDLRVNDGSTNVAIGCGSSPNSALGTCPGTVTFTRTGRPQSYTEFRSYVAELPAVQARCVSVSLTGQPRVTTDTDGNPGNGCN